MRLLVVEDEAAIACRIRESLEEARYTVDWARDGVEALSLAREREYARIEGKNKRDATFFTEPLRPETTRVRSGSRPHWRQSQQALPRHDYV